MSAKSFMRRRLIFLGVVGVFVVAAVVVWTLRRGGKGPAATVALSEKAPDDNAAGAAHPAEEPIDNVDIDIVEETLNLSDPKMEAQAEASLRVPPHEGHLGRVENIRRETIEETAANLGNGDDFVLAFTSMSGVMMSDVCTQSQVTVVTRLFRVRRLLAVGREDTEKVVPVLMRLTTEALDGWPQAHAVLWEKLGAPGGAKVSDSEPALQYTGRVRGSMYILAELGHHDALPLFLRTCRQGPPLCRRPPVPPGYTLYAMHRLVSSYPESKLSAEARKLRQEYLQSAECLPEPREITVTRWNAGYSESDPRIVVYDAEPVLDRQPTMNLPIYPHYFTDHVLFDVDTERANALLDKLEAFVRAAYPDEKF